MSDGQTPTSGKIDAGSVTSEQFLEKLRKALRRDGDFPASAKIVAELRKLTSDPKTTANQVTEVILREPSLGTRVLHLVNSSFYRRAKPIMTVSQAVIQIGMKPLSELCAGLVLLQKFIPLARRGGAFADCLQKTILTSLLSSNISAELSATNQTVKVDETGYLAGSFSELGTLLLAYYFPQVYESAIKRAESKRQDLSQSISEITGLSPSQLSIEVIEALGLPKFYRDTIVNAQSVATPGAAANSQPMPEELARVSKAIFAAQNISDVVVHSKNKQQLDAIISSVTAKIGLPPRALNSIVGELPNTFKNHCSSIELQLPSLPEFVEAYSEATPAGGTEQPSSLQEDKFAQFVDEIRQAVESHEPPATVITTVMETFAWSLNFDRVLLLLIASGKRKLVGRMLLGRMENFNPQTFERPVGNEANPYAPDATAFRESRPVFNGDPLLDKGWPLAVIPVGFGQKAIGVIYADRTATESRELSGREQAAIGVLAELLDRSISLHS